jgi:hypothetical protein
MFLPTPRSSACRSTRTARVPERRGFDRATLEAPVGANAFGTRLLADFAVNFRRPAA